MHSSSIPTQTEHRQVAQEYLEASLAALRDVYTIIYKERGSHSKDVIEPTFTALIEACFHKFNKLTSPRLFSHRINSLIEYIESLNATLNTHHHARMLFQILSTFNSLSFKNEILHDLKKDFLDNLSKCPEIIPGNPPKEASVKYDEFLMKLNKLKHFVENDTIDKINQAVKNNQSISDEVSRALFHASKGTGDTPGKIFAIKFMKEVVPEMPINKLCELTAGVMRAHTQDQVTGAELPFLRATGFITDELYWMCANKLNYDSRASESNEMMTMLNKELLVGKGYEFNSSTEKTPGQLRASVTNAVIEMDFKINSGAVATPADKILREVMVYVVKQKNKLPPPVPINFKRV